ncbi:ricin-type beta-trefoil lectin domain protein [Kitasatospora sp. NPDC096204]|uniref:ricin-type beta-trefoil lectin domain protein n=1 Tax=Kitasatospora sp. NPDC096204 TaxID=3364094 RepID=UPI0037F60D0B
MSPAKRIATAAVTAALLAATPGLAAAATPPTAPPAPQARNWFRLEVLPPTSPSVVKAMEVNSSGTVVMADREPNNNRQFWSMSGPTGKQLIENRATGTCLTAPTSGAGSRVTLQTCDKNNVNQQWNVRYWSQGLFTVSLTARPALYLTGGATIGTEVTIRIYTSTFAQHWAAVPPGF